MRFSRNACGLMVVAGLLGSLACGVGEDDDVTARLEGEWRWTASSGGIKGDVETVHPHAAARTVEFGADGRARFRIGEDVTLTRLFTVRPVQSIFDGVQRPALFYDGDDEGQVIELSDEDRSLALSQNAHDGFSSTFERMF